MNSKAISEQTKSPVSNAAPARWLRICFAAVAARGDKRHAAKVKPQSWFQRTGWNKPRFATVPLQTGDVYHAISAPLVKALTGSLMTQSLGQTQHRWSKGLLAALISLPIWLMIVLLLRWTLTPPCGRRWNNKKSEKSLARCRKSSPFDSLKKNMNGENAKKYKLLIYMEEIEMSDPERAHCFMKSAQPGHQKNSRRALWHSSKFVRCSISPG